MSLVKGDGTRLYLGQSVHPVILCPDYYNVGHIYETLVCPSSNFWAHVL